MPLPRARVVRPSIAPEIGHVVSGETERRHIRCADEAAQLPEMFFIKMLRSRYTSAGPAHYEWALYECRRRVSLATRGPRHEEDKALQIAGLHALCRSVVTLWRAREALPVLADAVLPWPRLEAWSDGTCLSPLSPSDTWQAA